MLMHFMEPAFMLLVQSLSTVFDLQELQFKGKALLLLKVILEEEPKLMELRIGLMPFS